MRATVAILVILAGGPLVAGPVVAEDLLDIGGVWTCTGSCHCVGTTLREASIAQNGNYLMLRNQCGDLSVGTLKGATIEALKWKSTGAVSSDSKQITWPNSMIWVRTEP